MGVQSIRGPGRRLRVTKGRAGGSVDFPSPSSLFAATRFSALV